MTAWPKSLLGCALFVCALIATACGGGDSGGEDAPLGFVEDVGFPASVSCEGRERETLVLGLIGTDIQALKPSLLRIRGFAGSDMVVQVNINDVRSVRKGPETLEISGLGSVTCAGATVEGCAIEIEIPADAEGNLYNAQAGEILSVGSSCGLSIDASSDSPGAVIGDGHY